MKRSRHSVRESAFSLIVILALVVLVAGLLATFLTRSRMELQATVSYSNSIEAAELARGGAEQVLGSLQAEVQTALQQNPGKPVISLARVGSDSIDPRVSSLVRRSTGNTSIFNDGYSAVGLTVRPRQLASESSSATPSKNGRSIPADRWLAPQLLATPYFSGAAAPDWTIVTRDGPARVTAADMDNLRNLENSANTKAAVGRYAYAVYDVSGLLDANIAGTPSTDTDVRRNEKGTLASADLSPVFDRATATSAAFLAWRQGSGNRMYGTDPQPGNFGLPGEMEVGSRAVQPTRNVFTSRQDLLKFMTSFGGGTAFPKSLAPYFTTYSRTSNGPEIPAVLNSAYNLVGDTEIPRYRVEDAQSEPFTIQAGSSLFARKFPLSRLRWFLLHESLGAPTPEAAAAIKQHFGLTWFNNLATSGLSAPEYQNVSGWIYTSPDGSAATSSIKTLDQIAQLSNKREPDFFEWLKEGIGAGSLGAYGGLTNLLLPGFAEGKSSQETSKDFQVIQIGANIIDQSDPDDAPTLIASDTAKDRKGQALVAFGVENLPYINELICAVSRNSSSISAYLQPEIWAPHANAGNTRFDGKGDPIKNFRVRIVEGAAVMDINLLLRAGEAGKALDIIAVESRRSRGIAIPRVFNGTADNTLEFEAGAADFNEPMLVGGAGSTNAFEWGKDRVLKPGPAPWEGGFKGILLGSTTVAASVFPEGQTFAIGEITKYGKDADEQTLLRKKFEDPTVPGVTYPIGRKLYNQVTVSCDPFYPNPKPLNYTPPGAPITVVLEAQVSGKWVPYQTWEQIQRFPALQVDPGTDYVDATKRGVFPFTYESADKLEPNEIEKENLSWCKPLSGNPYPTGNSVQAPFYFGWNMVRARASLGKSDPRTRRFGAAGSSAGMGGTPGVGIRDTSAALKTGSNLYNWDLRDVIPMGVSRAPDTFSADLGTIAGWTFSTARTAPLAALAKNISESGLTYMDPDQVVRPADFAYLPDVYFPAIPGQKRARPYILNRPFRSVAELGYVFRDVPWKSLDMIGARGADPAKPLNADLNLFNIFCIEDNDLVDGKINPFVAKPETLEAILRGARLNSSDATLGVVSNADAATIAQDLISQMRTDGGSVVTTADTIDLLNQLTKVKPSASGSQFKTEAEAYGRALGGVTNRRTWTLLLDVIAQAGRYPSGATRLEDFVVSGERRYWVHVTLDRYTGKVLHKEYEPVYE